MRSATSVNWFNTEALRTANSFWTKNAFAVFSLMPRLPSALTVAIRSSEPASTCLRKSTSFFERSSSIVPAISVAVFARAPRCTIPSARPTDRGEKNRFLPPFSLPTKLINFYYPIVLIDHTFRWKSSRHSIKWVSEKCGRNRIIAYLDIYCTRI